MNEEIQACRCCKKIYPLENFSKKRGNKNGHSTLCKSCQHNRNLKYYSEHKDKIKNQNNDYYYAHHEYAKTRQRSYNVINREHMKEWQKQYKLKGPPRNNSFAIRWAKENKQACEAYKILRNALSRNDITRPNICEICDKKSDIILGHHFDYSLPTTVIWVCPKCHRDIHKTQPVTLTKLDPKETRPSFERRRPVGKMKRVYVKAL